MQENWGAEKQGGFKNLVLCHLLQAVTPGNTGVPGLIAGLSLELPSPRNRACCECCSRCLLLN